MKAKINLTVEEDVSREARSLGVNMSQVAERAIAEANREARNRRWREENRDALERYTREVEKDGLPLARHRTF